VRYLEDHAERNELDVRLATRADRIDRDAEGWLVQTSAGEMAAAQVVVATG
jgi:glycine/D-amino acid oxidase-like deaminating enzyme